MQSRSRRNPSARSSQARRTRRLRLEALERRALLATLYWDPDGNPANNDLVFGTGLGGAGTWDTTTAGKWVDATNTPVTWSNGNDAVLFGTAGAVALGSPISAPSLSFKTTGYTVSANTLTLTGAATITTDAGVTATISSTIGGSAGLLKTGTGEVIFGAANNYTGATTLSQGTVTLTNAGGLSGSAVTLNDTNTGANAVALLGNLTNATIANAITVANLGTGVTTIGSNGGGAGGVGYSNTLTLNRATTFQGVNSDKTLFSGVITGNVGSTLR